MKRKELFNGLTEGELEALTKDLDREFIADPFRDMTPAERRQWNRIKRKRGRPRVGKGAKVVSVSFEGGLLTQIDRAAKRHGTSRAGFLASAAQLKLAQEQAPTRKRRSRKRAA